MITETQVVLRKQTPTAPNEWLYQSSMETRTKEVTNDDGTIETLTEEVEVRQFVRSAYLGNNADPWSECTDAEKEKWEEAARQREVEQDAEAESASVADRAAGDRGTEEAAV